MTILNFAFFQAFQKQLGAALIFSLLSIRAIGVTFTPLTIEALTTRADLVVQGTVLSRTCAKDESGRIYTRVELEVADVWKGSVAGTPLIIVHGGGSLDGRSSVVSGQVEYGVGEEVVAFLLRNERGEAVTVGLMQGKFHIWKLSGTETRYVVNPFHGIPEGTAVRMERTQQKSTSGTLAPLTLTELKTRVLEARP
jgi:hypothetical protein